MREVVTIEGKRIPLDEWQEMKGLDMHHICAAFTIDHPILRKMQTYYEPLLDIIDHLATRDNFKTLLALPKDDIDLNYQYCTEEGMSLHFYYAGGRKRLFFRRELPLVLMKLGYKARVKFHVQETSTMYVDVAPMYYGYAKPFAYLPHNEAWEESEFDEEDCRTNYKFRKHLLNSKYKQFLSKKEILQYEPINNPN